MFIYIATNLTPIDQHHAILSLKLVQYFKVALLDIFISKNRSGHLANNNSWQKQAPPFIHSQTC